MGGHDSDREHAHYVAAYARVAADAGTVEVPEVKATFRQHKASSGKAATVKAWAEDAAYRMRKRLLPA